MPPSSRSSEIQQRRNRSSVPERMGMRKWLECLLDNRQCYGLQWEDKAKKRFSIVWKHASSHGFDHSKHADVFMQWAQYKGRTVKEERNQKKKKGDNYDSKYKSNFRCALHSLNDCVEISGDEDGPKKLFQFLSPTDPLYKVRRDKKRNSYNKKAQKRTHDGKFSEGQKTVHNIDIKKCELRERFENATLTSQGTEFGHHAENKVMSACKGIKANDDKFSEGLKTAQDIDIKMDDLKERSESNENEIMALQGTKFETALEEDQFIIETLTENPQHLSGQPLQTLTYSALSPEMENTSLPIITLLQKETSGQVEIIYEDTSQEPCSSSSLPNFEALGVKDQYGPKTYLTSKLLASGGDMQVKKVAEETTEFAEPITVELPESNNPVNAQIILPTTSQEDPQECFDFIPENSSQDTDGSNIIGQSIPQDQGLFSYAFLPFQEDSDVITRSNNILNSTDIGMPFTDEELDFTSESDLPFCGSY